MINSIRVAGLSLFVAAIIGCQFNKAQLQSNGDNSAVAKQSVIAGNDVVGTSQIGERWTFQNNIGDFTFIDIQAAPAGYAVPGCVVWHYTKSIGRAYWQPGAINADLQFVLCPQTDGSWLAKASLFSGDSDTAGNSSHWSATQNIESVPGMQPGYVIVPSFAGSKTQSLITEYRNFNLPGVRTFENIESNINTRTVDRSWRTDSYITSICVPFNQWCGNALVSEQWEACDTTTWNGIGGCVHEKWYFAPQLGLIKVDLFNQDGNGEGNGFCTLGQCYSLHDISFQRVNPITP